MSELGLGRVKTLQHSQVIFDRFSRFCLPVHGRFAPESGFEAGGDKQKAR